MYRMCAWLPEVILRKSEHNSREPGVVSSASSVTSQALFCSPHIHMACTDVANDSLNALHAADTADCPTVTLEYAAYMN